MNTVALAAILGTFWGALAYVTGATLPAAIALGVMSTVAVIGLLGLARAGAARERVRRAALVREPCDEDAAKHKPRKRMIAAGQIGPERESAERLEDDDIWAIELRGLRLYETTVQDSGAEPRRAA